METKNVYRIAKFEKVSKEEYEKTIQKMMEENRFLNREDFVDYDEIKLPKRSTAKSAGYDIYAGMNITQKTIKDFGKINTMIENGGHAPHYVIHNIGIMVPTFVKCRIEDNWMLSIYPKSGLATKKHAVLMNTVGIIDADYYNNENNEGHILVPLVFDDLYEYGKKDTPSIEKNTKLVQGIFTMYGITEDDDCDEVRTGGFGSTGV